MVPMDLHKEVLNMEKTATLNLRVNPTVKQSAEAVLSKLGIPMSNQDALLNLQFCYIVP